MLTPTSWNFAGQRGCRLGFRVGVGLSEFVLLLLQEPILTFASAHFGLDDDPLSPKFLAIQSESHEPFAKRYGGIVRFRSDDLEFAEVPHDDLARAIFAFREGFLEQKVVERVVLHMDREALDLGILARPLGDRPRNEDRADF